MPARLPNFLVVGAMRAGTTSLARSLAEHPEVFLAPQKEVHFFDRHFDEGTDWYAGQFKDAGTQQAVGEATPAYMYDRQARTRMAELLSDARLVAVLRDPVDRAYSHYWFDRANKGEDLGFADAIAAEDAERAGTTRDRGTGKPRTYLDRGRYLPQLEALVERYPRRSVLVQLFEDWRDDPKDAYAALCRFLGVDPTFVPTSLGAQVNPSVQYRSLTVRRLSRRLPAGLHRAVGRLNLRPSSPPPMDPTTRSRLLERFASDNAALATWLGRDLSAWER